MPVVDFNCYQCGNCSFSLRDAFERRQNGSKLMLKVWAEEGCEVKDILSRINPIPLGRVNIILISGLCPTTTGDYISILKIDLTGSKGIIE